MPDDDAKRDDAVLTWVAEVAGATRATLGARIQSLWSGYGQVCRVRLDGASTESVILKWVVPPTSASHPRGWSGDRSHARKLRSYAIEMAFWREFSARCGDACRVPSCLAARTVENEFQFVLEDLDAAGFPRRRGALSPDEVKPCLEWLAAFHATFMGCSSRGLWPTGTYWHLETRPDELAATDDPALVRAAPRFDRMLNQATHQTLVHGDAKVANFCFSPDGHDVAAVDFQYVGGGVGVKDVAYLLSSCFDEATCERHAEACLDTYFAALRQGLREHHPTVDGAIVERQWRALYPVAWADFVRFLAGWAPGHWKRNEYSERMLRMAMAQVA